MTGVVTGLAVLGAVLSFTFVAVYAWRPWWRSSTGRILMATVAVLAVLFTLRALDRAELTAPQWAWALGYGVLDAGLAGLLWLLWHDERKEG